MRTAVLGVALGVWLAGVSSCSIRLDPCTDAAAGDELECPMSDYLDRSFALHVPPSFDGSPLPLIYAFHGGGGNRAAAEKVTCPGGESGHPDCLSAKATAAGYAIVFPDGTGTRPVRNSRTWNAGGGVGELQCVSGPACKSGVDDMRYLDDLHATLEQLIPIDTARVYATGLSNGGAISHRFACERADRLAAIAPVGGNNQLAAAGAPCSAGVAIMQIHGTEDPCWFFEDSTNACLQTDGKLKIGVNNSMEGWRERNGCTSDVVTTDIPDTADDGTTSTRIAYQGCSADVELIRVENGGHTWPQGDQYLGESRIGKVAQDFDGDDLILEFFDAHTR